MFADFQRYRLQTASIQKVRANAGWARMHKETPERLQLFEQTASWCRERQIDPRLWIYNLFRSRSWTFPPQLQANHLMSENLIPKYERLGYQVLDGYRERFTPKKKGPPFDPHVDISFTAEALKKLYQSQGDQARCLRETTDRTLGWHPKSSTCMTCPLAMQCRENLAKLVDFDIVGLREGRLTVEEAKAVVRGDQ